MKIYTKYGDKGKTFLPILGKVDKSHLLLETIGKIDELNCHVGILRTCDIDSLQNKILLGIQEKLFNLGSYLASDKISNNTWQQSINILEKNIDQLTDDLLPLDKFILPGGSVASAQAHLCRSVSRTVERRLVNFNQQNNVQADVLVWINRLSDYFFTLARFANHINNEPDVIWSNK